MRILQMCETQNMTRENPAKTVLYTFPILCYRTL